MPPIVVHISSPTVSNEEATGRLGSICRRRLEKSHDGELAAVFDERLHTELQSLDRHGISGQILELAAIADDAAMLGHEFRFEGAAASSLVLHAIGVAKPCPLRNGLLFERFLDPDPVTPMSPGEELHPSCVASQHAADTMRLLGHRGYDFRVVDHGEGTGGEQWAAQSIHAVLPNAEPDIPHLQLHVNGPSIVSLITAISARERAPDWLQDQAVFGHLGVGDTGGIPGLEHPDMQDALRAVTPHSLDDLAATIALAGQPSEPRRRLFDRFVAGDGDVPCLESESITKLLQPTRNLVLYQEDLMTILARVAAFTLREAYELIRAISTGKQDQIDAGHRRFVSHASPPAADQWTEEMFSLVRDRGPHTVCKAHCYATAYNYIEAACLKTHHPANFQAAVAAMSG